MRNTGSMGGCRIALAILSIVAFCVGVGTADIGTLPNTFGYANAGVACADIGDYEGAVVYYDKALQLYPDIAEIHYNKGVALEHLGLRQEAISEYEAAIELDPNLIQAQANLFLLTADFINPLTIAIIILGGCILILIHHRHRKKEEMEKRVMQGIIHE
ncbi:tetratricopeptide repeat protein [Methanogenium organophilum]|uniref:Tetratricopeptide repeat protein n=1 Tax=Methanogenium organophilum TaxID=2199 RepID=A0A9X9S572_METOG|nr:tetratricopeptide repeat protein [Methanogenium organophilum]WAI01680.1 tetratricopeptide repeat protein [Methanogenium organophilum]